CLSRLASSVLYRLATLFRRRRSGQERTPVILLFLRHNTSYLGMELSSIFYIPAPERDQGTIVIHHREGEQSQQSFLFEQRENLSHPRIGAEYGLGQN